MASAEMMQTQKATVAIKQLLAANAKLKSDLDATHLSYRQTFEELCILRKKYNDVVTKESVVVSQGGPNTELQRPLVKSKVSDVEKLAEQNIALRKKLECTCSPNEIQDFVERKEFDTLIQQYREIIQEKDKEISVLKSNISPSDLKIQVSQLEKTLQRTNAVKDAYAVEISSLQSRLGSFQPHNQEETTTAQAASGDADPNVSSSSCSYCNITTKDIEKLECEKKDLVERLNGVLISQDTERKLKHEYNTLVDRLKDAITNEKETQFKLDEAMANAMQFQYENDRLRQELAQMIASTKSSDDDLLKAQLKVFQEDFNDERKEKVKTYEDNQKLKGENSILKHDLERLSNLLQSKQSDKSSVNLQTTRSPLDHHGMHASATYPENFPRYLPDQTSRIEEHNFGRTPQNRMPNFNNPPYHRDMNYSHLNVQIPENDRAAHQPLQSAPPHHHPHGNEFPYTSQRSTPTMPYGPSTHFGPRGGRTQPDYQPIEDQFDFPLVAPKEDEKD